MNHLFVEKDKDGGDFMNKERQENYNDHAKFLADIASAILDDNKNVLDVNGVKEIISLYLLIPYMTTHTLMTPAEGCVIPHLEGLFLNGITYEDLRNTICHSFVTVEEDKGDGWHGKSLIFDDRVIINKKEHSNMSYHSGAYLMNVDSVHTKLKEMINEIICYKQ